MRNCLDVPSTATSRPRVASRPTPHRKRHYRTIFISDIHLGTRGCKADLLADFLTHHECRTLYLVGDIIDGWALKQGWFWSPAVPATDLPRLIETGFPDWRRKLIDRLNNE